VRSVTPQGSPPAERERVRTSVRRKRDRQRSRPTSEPLATSNDVRTGRAAASSDVSPKKEGSATQSTHEPAVGHEQRCAHRSSGSEFGRQSEERGIGDAVDARASRWPRATMCAPVERQRVRTSVRRKRDRRRSRRTSDAGARSGGAASHSHSMVPGGLLVMS
jgi:hypothetical protein